LHPAALQSETLESEARPHAVGLRWVIEGMFRWLGHFRRLMVRYEYWVEVYWAFVVLAFILICLDRILK
jgi:transposase